MYIQFLKIKLVSVFIESFLSVKISINLVFLLAFLILKASVTLWLRTLDMLVCVFIRYHSRNKQQTGSLHLGYANTLIHPHHTFN